MPPRRHPEPPKPAPNGPSAPAGEPIDRAASLLDHADDANDVIQFWEENAGGRWDYIERFDVPDVRALGLEEFVLQRYGGGRYKAGIRARSSGTYGKSVVLSIAGPRRSDHERGVLRTPGGSAPAAAASAPAAVVGGQLPDWVKSIVMPIAVTLGTTLAKKLLDPAPAPSIDPTLLKLLADRPRPAAGGEAIDVLKMTELLRQAEERGERRGRELGELVAGGQGDGVAGVVGQVIPVMNRMLDHRDAGQAPRRELPAGAPANDQPAEAMAPTDIVPAWLRPFVRYKGFVIEAADSGRSALPIAGMVIENASEEAWAAIVSADEAKRLEEDIYAAMPELRATEPRRVFVGQVVQELRTAMQEGEEQAHA